MSELNPYEAPADKFAPPDPNQYSSDAESGLGGWLILVGIGVTLSPVRIAFLILTTFVPLFTDGTWDSLTSPASPNYNPLWGPLLIFEIVANVAFVIGYTCLAFGFFTKKSWFPKTYIALAICNLLFIVADAVFASSLMVGEPIFDEQTLQEVVRSLIGACIWCPYMLLSKRVKKTFVR